MNDIGISQQDKLHIYNILAGILHLGNINFEDDHESTQNGCKIIPTSEQVLIITAQMLHVDLHDLRNVLLTRILTNENTIISSVNYI
jgi:myosin-6